jgi:hypothetical protein
MGVLKTLGCASLITFLAVTAAKPEDDLLRRVTDCVGRLSAQIEHQWLLSDLPTEQIETQRAHLEDILDALVTPDSATRVLSNRIDAKFAHASLLTQAAFSSDDRRARWAEKRAEQELLQCGGLLLQPARETPTSIALGHGPAIESVNHEAWHASK